MKAHKTLTAAAKEIRADHVIGDRDGAFWLAVANAMDRVAIAVRMDTDFLHRVGYGEIYAAAVAYLTEDCKP